MKNKNTRILLIEDNPGDIRLVREALAEAGAPRFDLVAKMNLASGLAALAAQPMDAILLDLTLPDAAGFETFTKVHEKAHQVPIIVLTGADDDVQAAKALREGAQDYLVKGQGNSELLVRSIRYAIQRKQSEEALRENEARYRNIFEGVEDAIFVETLSGQILDVNQRACEMYGYTRDQLLTKTVADLVPSKEHSVLLSPDDPAIHLDHPIETINVRSNGEQFPIELSLRKQESKGEPFLFVVCRDITERKQAEQAVRESEARHRAIFDGASIGIAFGDLSGRFVDINHALQSILGYNLEELTSKTLADLTHPDDLAIDFEMFQETLAGQRQQYQIEKRYFHKDGHIVWGNARITVVRDENGQPEYAIGMIEDITGRKQAEEARQESELLLRALFELSPDSIMLMDPHTPDESWPIIDCNLAACRINGYERDELIGNSIDMLNAFPANPVDRAAYRKRMRDQGSLHLEASHRHKDGTVFPVEISTRLIQVGQRELVIGIDRDITERKQVEAALRDSEERFREIFENMSSGVVVYEPVDGGNDFKFNHFNRAAEKIENITRDAVIGKTVCEVFPGVKEFGLFETLQRVWKNGQPEHLPITLYTDERMSGWRENYIARLPSGEVLVVYDDVTESRLAEEALRESEELFRSFIEQSSEGVILLDEQGCIIEWNHAQAQITGITAEQAIGTPFGEIQYRMLPPDRRSERSPEFFKQAMLDAFQTGKFPTTNKAIETKIFTPQGETKFILQASFPIHSEKGYRIGSLVRDITERKRAEIELQASHKAEQDFSERLSTLLEVTTELSKTGGLDESCRRAVELGRERLGLDRLSIWFISDDHTTMQGTFGVDVAGRITDERHERFIIRPDFPVWTLVEGQVPLVHVPGESLYLDGQVIGQGDHVFAGLWDGNIVTGYISVDNLLSQRPFSDHDCEIIRLYASAVGRLISLKRAEATLRTSEENYRGAIAAAGLVPYGIDYETQRFTFMGDNILQLTGYSADEITPAILKDCVQESHVWGLEATGVTQEEAPRRFRSGEIKQWGNDLRITTRSGEERWLSDVSVPLQDKLGKVTSAIGIFQDLTGRKQAEQALQKSEARFRSIFENTAIGFYQTTPAGQILLANPAILHMLGYESFEDLSKRNLEDRDYQLEYPRTEFRRRIETDGEIKDLETAWVKADNTTLYVRENARVVRDESGKVLYYEGTVEDITERKQAEKKLEEERILLRTLIDNIPDRVYAMDAQGRKILSNISDWQASGGKKLEDVIGKTDLETYPPELAKDYWAIDQAVIETGKPVINLEEPGLDSAGNPVQILSSKVPLHDLQGRVMGLVGIGRDITQLRQAEESIRTSEEKFRKAFVISPDAININRLQDGKYVAINNGFTQIMGYSETDCIGKTSVELNIWADPNDRKALVDGLQKNGEVANLEARFCAKNGDIKIGLMSASLLELNNIPHIISITRDITERKQVEQALQDSEQLFRKVFTEEPISLALSDKHYHFLQVNPAFCRMLGYTEQEFELLTFKDITLPEDIRDSVRNIHELENGNVPVFKTEKRYITKNKAVIWGSLTLSTILDQEGQLQFFLVMIEDITDRKQAEAALVKTERIYRQAITGAGGVPYQVDYGNDCYVFLGEGIQNLTGYLAEEMTGSEFFASRIRQVESYGEYKELPHEQRIQLSRQDGSLQEWREDYLFERKDGTLVWLSDHSVPVLGAAGNLIGSLGILMDITERKQAEAALRESEERFRFIFENANDAIFIENARDEFLSANQRACEMLGYSMEEFQKLHVADIQAPEVRQPGSVIKNEMLQHKGSIFEGLDLHSSGRRIPVEVSVGQIEQASGDLYVSIVRDITERKQAEAALAHQSEQLRQRNSELARLYRASSSLLSGASSNLQELAQTIIGIIQQEFGQANCSLFLVQRDSIELQRLAAAGPYTDQVKKKTLTLDGPGLVPQAIRTGQTVNEGNVHAVPDYLPNWESAMSEMAVPLKIGNDVIGIIDTQSALPDAFDKQDESLMTIFAERAALALEHSRMYEQTEARVQQLAALRTVDMAISSSFDIHLTLDILLDQVRAQLGVDAADILEYNQVTQTFSFSCGQGFRTHALQHTHLRLGEGYAGRAAMERRLLKVPDLHAEPSGFGRSPLLVGENFLSYAGVPLIAKGQIKGVLEIFNREPLDLSAEQQAFLEILAGQAGIAMDNAELYEHQQRSIADLTIAYNDTLEGWASALELRDKETEGHTRRVTNLTIRLARALGVSENDQVQIYRGALLHDIGKIGVPDSIVLKPGPLTGEEWEIMRQHPLYAYNMLSPIGYLREALHVPYCHHEKWDGTGYPRGLKAEEIPLAARIFSVVDVWDALTSDRPYRKAWTHEKARLYMTEQSGTQFEPRVLETFFREVLTQ